MIDIIVKKKNVYTIISTNISKNLVYQVIPIIVEGFILVILFIITLIENQIRTSSK